jgi:membrane protein implicated in regulation of membrane protease activity
MNLLKFNKFLEIFWWACAVLTLIMVVTMIFIQGWDKWAIYFIAPVLCVILALVRRFLGKRLKNSEAFRDKGK